MATPTTGSELATAPLAPGFAKASSELSLTLGLTPLMMTNVLRSQCFRNVHPDKVTDEMLASFIVIANEMKVNPLLPGMMYAYPGKDGGIVPMMGPDAVFKKLQEHAEVDSWQCDVFPPPETGKEPTHATMSIWRKGRERPLTKTCLLNEWKVSSNPNWVTRPRHMLELRTIKQGARMIIHGIPFDEDERVIMGETVVTGTGEGDAPDAPPTRTKGPKKSASGAAAVVGEQAPPPPEKPANGGRAGNVIEGEFTEVKRAEAAAAAASTTPPPAEAPPPVEPPAAKTETPPAKSGTTEAKSETPPARAFLKDGETLDTTVTVKSVETLNINQANVKTPSIQASVAGGFIGTVIHIGGATGKGDILTPLPMWEVGKTLNVSLFGKLNKATGEVMARVKTAAVATGEMQIED